MNTLGRVRRRFHNKITGWYVSGYIPCCVYCGKKFYSRQGITVDHKIPLKLGGTHDAENLVPSCVNCNRNKGHKLIKAAYPEKVKHD